MWGAGGTYSEYSAGQNEGPEVVSGLFAFIPPPKGSGCSRSGYKRLSITGDSSWNPADVSWSIVGGPYPQASAWAVGVISGTTGIGTSSSYSFVISASYKGVEVLQEYSMLVLIT